MLQLYLCIFSFFTLTLANITPLLKLYKKLLFLSQLLIEAYSTAESKQRQAHTGRPRKDCIFYLSPLSFIFTVNS